MVMTWDSYARYLLSNISRALSFTLCLFELFWACRILDVYLGFPLFNTFSSCLLIKKKVVLFVSLDFG